MRIGAGALAAGAAAKVTILDPTTMLAATMQAQAGNTIRFASIGTGVRGCELLKASLRVPGKPCQPTTSNTATPATSSEARER